MGGRYLISGVQLGILVGLQDYEDRKEMVDKIVNNQFVCNSNQNVEKDFEKIFDEKYKVNTGNDIEKGLEKVKKVLDNYNGKSK